MAEYRMDTIADALCNPLHCIRKFRVLLSPCSWGRDVCRTSIKEVPERRGFLCNYVVFRMCRHKVALESSEGGMLGGSWDRAVINEKAFNILNLL